MRRLFVKPLLIVSLTIFLHRSQVVAEPLTVATESTSPTVYLHKEAGEWETKAAEDTVRCIAAMTGGTPILSTEEPTGRTAEILIGRKALEAEPQLRDMLQKVRAKKPLVRADAVALLRKGQQIYLAGTNDDSHYYAAVELLNRWGCRWYLPTELGECLPQKKSLTVDELNYAYAPPFEVRTYWISWNGDYTDYQAFARRNFFNLIQPGGAGGHALGDFTTELGADFSLLDEKTATVIADKAAEKFASGQDLSLSIQDATMSLSSEQDVNFSGHLYDKCFLAPVVTDSYLDLYNRVCGILKAKYPDSKSLIGFLAYTNLTMPPQRITSAAKPLVCYLAPIDVDPNHSMNDEKSPARQDYREMMKAWSRVMEGRVIIYDYDQGMLVWRDLPNPSHHVMKEDIKHYRDAGILGFNTESRNAIATTFLNLHFRGQLYWNPDYPVEAGLQEFYPAFYGSAAEPMERYWGAIFRAWEETIATEHEFFVIPAIYTPELVQRLGIILQEVEGEDNPRLHFTRGSYQMIKSYTDSARLAATENRYKEAAQRGLAGLEARRELKASADLFVTDVLESGEAFWPGEVDYYKSLADLTASHKILQTPLEWTYTPDPYDEGTWRGWAAGPLEGRAIRTDLYLQAQGILTEDHHTPPGFGWYSTEVDLPQGNWHLMFPGLFNQGWLYLNGVLIARRAQHPLWWRNDYNFQWDVDLSGHTRKGKNRIVLRIPMSLHLAGMFRRPFFYSPTSR